MSEFIVRVADAFHSRSRISLVDAGHFIWEDAADEYAALVNAWWADGFKACMKTSTAIAACS